MPVPYSRHWPKIAETAPGWDIEKLAGENMTLAGLNETAMVHIDARGGFPR